MQKKPILFFVIILVCVKAHGRAYLDCKSMISYSMWPEFIQHCSGNLDTSTILKISYMYEKGIFVTKDCMVAKKYIETINLDNIDDKLIRKEVDIAAEAIESCLNKR